MLGSRGLSRIVVSAWAIAPAGAPRCISGSPAAGAPTHNSDLVRLPSRARSALRGHDFVADEAAPLQRVPFGGTDRCRELPPVAGPRVFRLPQASHSYRR